MEDLFEQLTRCKDDEQQRNWMLYEDETTIRDLLQVSVPYFEVHLTTHDNEKNIKLNHLTSIK